MEIKHQDFVLRIIQSCLFAVSVLTVRAGVTSQNATLTLAGIEFVILEGGDFRMGCPSNPPPPWKPDPSARPEHVVRLSPFAMSKYPVTFDNFCTFLNGSRVTLLPNLDNLLLSELLRSNKLYFPKKGRENYPATGIRFQLAKEYCLWLSDETGRVIRLPTEAEWEYAAKGKKARTYPWGETILLRDTYGSAGRLSVMATPEGIYDLNGPVLQWCLDAYVPDFYRKSPTDNPLCETGSGRRVVRGGSVMRMGPREELVYPATWTRFGTSETPDKYGLPKGIRLVLTLGTNAVSDVPK